METNNTISNNNDDLRYNQKNIDTEIVVMTLSIISLLASLLVSLFVSSLASSPLAFIAFSSRASLNFFRRNLAYCLFLLAITVEVLVLMILPFVLSEGLPLHLVYVY